METNTYSTIHGLSTQSTTELNKDCGKQLAVYYTLNKRPNVRSQTRTNRAYELRVGAVRKPVRDPTPNYQSAAPRQSRQGLTNDNMMDPTAYDEQYVNNIVIIPPNTDVSFEPGDMNHQSPEISITRSGGLVKSRNDSQERVHPVKPMCNDQNSRCQGDSNMKDKNHEINDPQTSVFLHRNSPQKCHPSEKRSNRNMDTEREARIFRDMQLDHSRALRTVNEANINWMTTCESQIQLQPSAESGDPVFSRINVTEEDQPVLVTVQPPLVTKAAANPLPVRRNGDQTGDHTIEQFSPYTSPSLSTEEVSTPTKRRKSLLATQSSRALPYRIPTNRQLPMLSQSVWREQERRHMERTTSNPPKMARKSKKRWRSRGFMTLFGCLRTDHDDGTDATQSSFSRIDLAHDNSNTEDQRTSAISGSSVPTSKTRETSAEKDTDSQTTKATSMVKKELEKVKSICQPVHSQMPIKPGRRFVLKKHYLHRTSRPFIKINKTVAQLIKQQSCGMETIYKEFGNVQRSIREMTCRIDMITQSLESQKKTLLDFIRRIETQKIVDNSQNPDRFPPVIKIPSNRHSGERTEVLQHGSGDTVPVTGTACRPADITLKRDHSLPTRHLQTRNLHTCDSQQSSSNIFCVSPQRPETQAQKQQQCLNSSDDCTVGTEHHSKQSDETNSHNPSYKGSSMDVRRNHSISIRKPSFLCTNQGDGCHQYFSVSKNSHAKHVNQANEKTQGPNTTANMNLVNHSEPTSHSSAPTSPTTTQDEAEQQAQDNHDLQNYYRIAYVEQDATGLQNVLYRGQRLAAASAQAADSHCLRNLSDDMNHANPGRVLKEARLTATEFIPRSRTESKGLENSLIHASSTNNQAQDIQLKHKRKGFHPLTNRAPHSHHAIHHTHRRELIQQTKDHKPSLTCRRRIVVQKPGDIIRPSHKQMCAGYRNTSAIPYDETDEDYLPEPVPKLHHVEQRQISESYYTTAPDPSAKMGETRPHHQYTKQRHKSKANRHAKFRESLLTNQSATDRPKRHQTAAAMCKSKHHQKWIDRNNNSQDWEPNETDLLNANQVCTDFAELSFDELHQKPQTKLRFVVSKPVRNQAESTIAGDRKKPMEFALPGPEQDKQMGVVERFMDAKREKRRTEDEQRIMDELKRIANQHKERLGEKMNPNGDNICEGSNQAQTSNLIDETLKTPPESASEQNPQPNKEMTALERCREQRRRRLEEKTQTDLKMIVAMTEQTVAERRARTSRRNPQGSEQIGNVLNNMAERVTGVGETLPEQPNPKLTLRKENKNAQSVTSDAPTSPFDTHLETEKDAQKMVASDIASFPRRLEENGVQTCNETMVEMKMETPRLPVHLMTANSWNAPGYYVACGMPLIVPSYSYYSWPNLIPLSHTIPLSYAPALLPRPALHTVSDPRTTRDAIRAATQGAYPTKTNCIECESSSSSSLSTTCSRGTSSFGTNESVDTDCVPTDSSSSSPAGDHYKNETRSGNEFHNTKRYTSPPPRPGNRTCVPLQNPLTTTVNSYAHPIHFRFGRGMLSGTRQYSSNQAPRYPPQRTVRFQLNKPR
ncbi:unnamed protein product [Fasciola hepatica]|uniref:Uncharacterized protein n=1 Tax=Fasciola hepatica TaxID=6192 RepID=A0ABC9HJC2_FASHE|nr:unnamed protein product [Fasciola hepatica]